jgi:hypothetical protein
VKPRNLHTGLHSFTILKYKCHGSILKIKSLEDSYAFCVWFVLQPGMALKIFRRHKKECIEKRGCDKGRIYRRCDCPIHVEGSLRGEKVRQALDLTSFEAAERTVRDCEVAGKIGGAPSKMSLADVRAASVREAPVSPCYRVATTPWQDG